MEEMASARTGRACPQCAGTCTGSCTPGSGPPHRPEPSNAKGKKTPGRPGGASPGGDVSEGRRSDTGELFGEGENSGAAARSSGDFGWALSTVSTEPASPIRTETSPGSIHTVTSAHTAACFSATPAL